MKLGGHMGHGPNSSYHHLWYHMTCCHWIMTENVLTNCTNECTNCEVPRRDGENSLLPWYLAPCPKHFLYLKFSADLWPDLDIGQRSENVQIVISRSIFTWTRYRSKVRKYSKCYFALNFFQIFTKFGREDHNGELLEPSLKIFWSDLTWLGHVTLNYSVRSLYIEKLEFRLDLCISKQALVHQAKKAGSNHYFMIWPLDLWPMFTIRSHVFKGLYLQNGDP